MYPVLNKEATNAMRGVAIISVIISHFVGGGYGIRLVTPLGGIGVAMFLILSGYGINESYKRKGLDKYWRNKATRILTPYLLWTVLLSVISLIEKLDIHFPLRYWFLEYLFLWYLVYYLARKRILQGLIYVMFVFVLLSFVLFPCL